MGISTIVKGFLYLGAARDTKNEQEMKRLNISHIVSCAGRVKLAQNYNILKAHNLEDEPKQDILTFIEESFHFIEKAREDKGTVFVHCLAGKSRSPTIIIAYLMRTQNVPLKQIYHLVYEARDIIQPNDGFMMQLLQLEKQLLGSNSFQVCEWKDIKPKHNKKSKFAYQLKVNKQLEQLDENDKSTTSTTSTTSTANTSTEENAKRSEEEMKQLKNDLEAMALTRKSYVAKLSSEISDKINEYLEQVLTVELLLKAMGNADLYSTLSTHINNRRPCGNLMGQIKKYVGKELFTATSGGEYLREKDQRIEWKDIANSIEPRIILLIEKEIFQKKLIL